MGKMNTGIYAIEHVESGKLYVGSAISFKNRWKEHRSLLRRGIHHSAHLQAAWTKYGESAFVFRKMLVCSKENLLMYEQLCIDGYGVCDRAKGYNASPTAGSCLGYKHDPEKTKSWNAKRKGVARPPFTLEWKENIRDGHGVKLNMEKAREIRIKCAAGATHQRIADEYGVSRQLVSDVAINKAWREDLSVERHKSPRVYKPHREETKETIRIKKTGRPRSAESIAKQVATITGRPKAPFTAEHKANIRAARLRWLEQHKA